MSSYAQELDGLAQTYLRARDANLEPNLNAASALLAAGALVVVASGGASAVAELAVNLHVRQTGHAAFPATPLRLVELVASGLRSTVLVFSSRARHPDTEVAVRSALRAELKVVLVTERAASDLSGALADPAVVVVTVPPADPPDGFLATGSVLTMAVVALRLYGTSLPPTMPKADFRPEELRGRLLVLHGTDGRPAAVDVETRLHELGLADVQITDYRNLAHGRHVGLGRRSETTTVLALVSPPIGLLAAQTLQTLGPGIDVRWVKAAEHNSMAQLALLVGVMLIPSLYSSITGVEPSRPGVSASGRRLYHLPVRRKLPMLVSTPVTRKLAAAGWTSSEVAAETLYRDAYADWSRRVRAASIDAILLDYDGTCVTTKGRYALPAEDVQQKLTAVLAGGTPLIFATGRGDSLYRDLRRWLPHHWWPQVTLALHNGAWRQQLDEELREPPEANADWVSDLVDALNPFVRAGCLSVRATPTQVTVSPPPGASADAAWRVTHALVDRSAFQHLRVARSGHSIDVIPAELGKDYVLHETESRLGWVLSVGDQGAPGGNDFHLLAAGEATLSVDRCSADPSRCWNISPPGVSGPAALIFVLTRLRRRRERLYLDPPVLKS